MRELKVVDVRRMTTFAHGDDVVYGGAQRMGVLQGEVHGPPAYTAYRLRCVDPLLILFILGTVSLLFVRSVSHSLYNAKEPATTGSLLKGIL